MTTTIRAKKGENPSLRAEAGTTRAPSARLRPPQPSPWSLTGPAALPPPWRRSPRLPRPQRGGPRPRAGPYQDPPVLLPGMRRVPVSVDGEPHGVGLPQPSVGEPHCKAAGRGRQTGQRPPPAPPAARPSPASPSTAGCSASGSPR